MLRDSGWGAQNPFDTLRDFQRIYRSTHALWSIALLSSICVFALWQFVQAHLLPRTNVQPDSRTTQVTWTNHLDRPMHRIPCSRMTGMLAPHLAIVFVVPVKRLVQWSWKPVFHNSIPCKTKNVNIGLPAELSGYHVANVQARSSR